MARKIIMAFALFSSTQSIADVPNLFDQNQMSSEAIWVGINSCEQGYAKNPLNPSLPNNVVWSYCACFVDSLRTGKSFDKSSAKTCMNRAIRLYAKKTK